jgi:hypothetical protein
LDDVILETHGLTKEFRGFAAVQGVDLQVRRGTGSAAPAAANLDAAFATKVRDRTSSPLYNPARLVAEIATADALSNGRLMLGVDAGYQPYEFERFGVDIKATSIAQGSARR